MSSKKILAFTGTRSDYGIMFWLLKDLDAQPGIDLQLLVSGSHLCSQYGLTYGEIERDGFKIGRKVDTVLSGDTPTSIPKSVGIGILGYADTIDELKPDVVIILGDRYEAFAMAQAAFMMKVPIVHLHGGEITEGANDDRMRHAISKLSDLHFTSTENHRNRVIQMGEQPDCVITAGAPGLEHIYRSELPSVEKISEVFSFDFEIPYILIAFHPVTNVADSGIGELKALLDACSTVTSHNYVLSLSNADIHASRVTREIEFFKARAKTGVLVEKSFGHLNFLSIIKNAALMIGNSSSGVIEAPSLMTPSIDVGIRQFGRDRAGSVSSVSGGCKTIAKEISQVMSHDYSNEAFSNPYYRTNSSHIMVEKICCKKYSLRKTFYDLAKGRFQ